MSMELCVLASGSAGNCTVLRTPAGVLLIDAGLGPRLVAQRLAGSGVGVADVSAVCLTHLDSDHFNANWLPALARRRVDLHCHVNQAHHVRRIVSERECAVPPLWPFNHEPFEPLPGLRAHPIELAHDAEGSHGFVFEGFGARIGFATDLGHVPEALIERFCGGEGLDLLAIEANYDPRMQLDSPRPAFLKHRVMGGRGHLSNEQAFDAVRRVLNRCTRDRARLPMHVVLLHRSRQCNCPERVRQCFARDPRIAARLVFAEQHAPTPWLRLRREKPFIGEQLALAWG